MGKKSLYSYSRSGPLALDFSNVSFYSAFVERSSLHMGCLQYCTTLYFRNSYSRVYGVYRVSISFRSRPPPLFNPPPTVVVTPDERTACLYCAEALSDVPSGHWSRRWLAELA